MTRELRQTLQRIGSSAKHGRVANRFPGGGIGHGFEGDGVGPSFRDDLNVQRTERNTDEILDVRVHDPSRQGTVGCVVEKIEVELVFAQFDGDPTVGGPVVMPGSCGRAVVMIVIMFAAAGHEQRQSGNHPETTMRRFHRLNFNW